MMPAVAAVGVTAKCDLQKDATSTPDWSISGCVTRGEGLPIEHGSTVWHTEDLAECNKALSGTVHAQGHIA
jgi:hypothetical protein